MPKSGGISSRKARGAHYTPPALARFVAERLVRVAEPPPDGFRILDPSCGEGELLLAIADLLPDSVLQKSELIGVETDPIALRTARRRLENLPVKNLVLEQLDFLDFCMENRTQLTLFNLSYQCSLGKPVDIIIANPPYVRTQILGAKKSQELAERFGLAGRVDLYHAFLIGMTECLVPGGYLGVITSNRFLTTQTGASVRRYLSSKYDILEIVDLGDTKLFDAAVLPSVFIGRRRSERCVERTRSGRFLRIYECDSSQDDIPVSSVFDALRMEKTGAYKVNNRSFRITVGPLTLPKTPQEPWAMMTDEECRWIETVQQGAKYRVSDFFKVRVGVKTTADEVFIRKDWATLPEEIRPEEELLYPLLSAEDAAKWRPVSASCTGKKILYTHRVRFGKREAIPLEEYPKAAAYLNEHRTRLERRSYVLQAKRNWYEIWVPQDPDAWKRPKIVFPDISPEPKFFFDDQGCVVDGNCYWICCEDEQDLDLLFLVQGVANSRLMTRYHDLAFNNKLYAGRRRYLTQYIEQYPIPDPDKEESKRIVVIVRQLVFERHSDRVRSELEAALEDAVAAAYGVEPWEE